MNRKISIGGAITLAIMFSTVTFIMTMIYAQNDFNGKVYDIQQREKMYAKLSEVDTKVRKEYLHPIDEDALRDRMIAGYVAGLGDDYGMYLTAEQYSEMMSGYDGRMVDIGVVCAQDAAGYIRVEEVYEASPAD
ncbi:MAG: peptidase, partial [Oscillospiraceae bacterium]